MSSGVNVHLLTTFQTMDSLLLLLPHIRVIVVDHWLLHRRIVIMVILKIYKLGE